MSFSEWRQYRLGKLVVSANTGLDAIKRAPIVKNDTGIKCLRIQDVSQDKAFDSWGFCDVTEINYGKFQLRKNDLIIARTGETVGVNRLIKEDAKSVFNNGLIRIRVDESKLTPVYLYYSFQSLVFKTHIHSIAHGTSTQPNMRIEALLDYKITIPGLKVQKQITSVLSSLDDKIELNRQTNQTLEAMAKVIFKEMCLPKGGVLEGGWRVGKLGEELEIKYGKDHKHLEHGDIPVYGSGGIMRYANKSIYQNESILIPRKGTLSNLFYINEPFWSVDTMFYTKINNVTHTKFLFLLLKSMDLSAMNVGSAVPSLTTDLLKKIKIIIPSNEILKDFDLKITPLFQLQEQNINENKSLQSIRDSLLPKLMRGKIKIN